MFQPGTANMFRFPQHNDPGDSLLKEVSDLYQCAFVCCIYECFILKYHGQPILIFISTWCVVISLLIPFPLVACLCLAAEWCDVINCYLSNCCS